MATCDANGNEVGTGPAYVAPFSTIDILIVAAGALGPDTGGQFVQSDLSPQDVANCSHAQSNQAAVITIALDPATTNLDYFMKTFMAHEATHLIAFVANAITLGHSGALPGLIDEGLAQLSQEVVLGAPDYSSIYDRVRPFLLAPQNYAVLTMNGIEDAQQRPYTLGNYGAAYLLMRYVADHAGLGFAHAYITSDPTTSAAQSFATLATAAGQPSFAQLFENFGITLAAAGAAPASASLYSITSFALNGTYTGPTATSTGTSFTFPGVVAAGALPGTPTTPLFPGGVSIVGLSPALGGTRISVTDPTAALQLNGAIFSF